MMNASLLDAPQRIRGSEIRDIKSHLRAMEKLKKLQCSKENDDSSKLLPDSDELLTDSQQDVMIKDFREKDELSNVVLIVEETELYVHKEVLAQWSPVFMAMFTGPFEERDSCRVNLPGKTLEDIILLLNCIYPPQLKITELNCMQLLPLVEEYDITHLKPKCEEIILAQPPSLDIVLLAQNYNMSRVLQKAINACSELSMSKLDYVGSETAASITRETLLSIYRLKIVREEERRKAAEKEMKGAAERMRRLKNWGQSRNSYTCDTHMCLNEECAHCLKNFRRTVLDQISG